MQEDAGRQPGAVVKLYANSGSIEAKPDPAELKLGQTLQWEVDTDGDSKVEIDFEKKQGEENEQHKGPFRHQVGNPHNPTRGVYERRGPGNIDTAASDQKGRWKYSVTVRDAKGNETAKLDPEVDIRG